MMGVPPMRRSAPACDFAVVGAGIVGLAAAYKLLLARPGAAVVVLEKEATVGSHQSGHNSGVLHAGLEYTPGSLKAALAVAGIRQMTAFCSEHDIPHDVCGKLVVAATDAEVPRLRQLMQRGAQNGLRGLEWLEPARMREIERRARGSARCGRRERIGSWKQRRVTSVQRFW